MKRLFVVLFAFVLTFSLSNLEAAEQAAENAPQTAQSSVDDLPTPPVSVNCTFDCPISTSRTFEGCISVDDCKSISEDRIKLMIRRWAARICDKLQECCRENGCVEFACEVVDAKFGCRDENTLCVKVEIAWKCR